MSGTTHPARILRPLPAGPSPRGAVARVVLASTLRRVGVRAVLSDGTHLAGPDVASHPHAPTVEVVRPGSLFDRLARNPKMGIGESYTAGDWRPAPGTDLAEVLLPFAERFTSAVPRALWPLRRLVDVRPPAGRRNTPAGARENIRAHYDLSNDLFAAFLDDTMTYSSALFDGTRPWAAQSLEAAQLRKVHAVLDLAAVTSGMSVLEIGTGWGTLAVEAARRGARVTSVTLSAEQALLARDRARVAGVADRVDIRLCDYREVRGLYDAVVSVEMVEAVGEEYWPTYFAAIDRLLAPGGTVALQSILMDHSRYRATRRSHGWIQEHVFPGGLIPSLTAIERVTRAHTALRVQDVTPFGQHYAETLRRWRRTFTEAWPAVHDLGFDETFRRTWEFYLAYCEAGFAAGYLDVAHLRLRRSDR